MHSATHKCTQHSALHQLGRHRERATRASFRVHAKGFGSGSAIPRRQRTPTKPVPQNPESSDGTSGTSLSPTNFAELDQLLSSMPRHLAVQVAEAVHAAIHEEEETQQHGGATPPAVSSSNAAAESGSPATLWTQEVQQELERLGMSASMGGVQRGSRGQEKELGTTTAASGDPLGQEESREGEQEGGAAAAAAQQAHAGSQSYMPAQVTGGTAASGSSRGDSGRRPQSFGEWIKAAYARRKGEGSVPLPAPPSQLKGVGRRTKRTGAPMQQQQQPSSSSRGARVLAPRADVSSNGADTPLPSALALDSDFRLGPLPGDLAFSPEAQALRAQHQQERQQQQQPDEVRSEASSAPQEEPQQTSRQQPDEVRSEASSAPQVEPQRTGGQPASQPEVEEVDATPASASSGVLPAEQREAEDSEKQALARELQAARDRISMLDGAVADNVALNREVMAMNQELVARNQQLLDAMPRFIEMSKSHELVLQQLQGARDELASITQERDALQEQVQAMSIQGRAQSTVATAEQKLQLTRKVSGIMQHVLKSEMEPSQKMSLGCNISELLQLLLQ